MSEELTATVLVCTLRPSPAQSSSELLASQLIDELAKHNVTGKLYRIVDYNVKFGVEKDMGNGDDWPQIREAIVQSDILIVATPIWMGQPSSVSKVVMERLDAEISETDDAGRPSMYGKVANVAIVGNEDGAHHTSAELYQVLTDVGFTIPAGGPTYWTGEAMGSVDYKDLKETPVKTALTTRLAAANTAHLARLLKRDQYPVTQ